MSIEAMKQALEALIAVEALIEHQYTGTRDGMTAFQDASDDAHLAIEPLRQAIEQAEKQEPVAWASDVKFDSETTFCLPKEKGELGTAGLSIPLYTSPHHRKPWIGLTDEDVTWLCNTAKSHHQTWGMFVRSVERKLKEKNT